MGRLHKAEISNISFQVGWNQTIIDFAVMRECNHSIHDYGSYALWGALLRTRDYGLTVIAHEKSYTDKFPKDNHFVREANLTDLYWLYVKGDKSVMCLSEKCKEELGKIGVRGTIW